MLKCCQKVRLKQFLANPSLRMQPGGYNTELITRLISSSLGENLRVNLPKLQLPEFDGNLQ